MADRFFPNIMPDFVAETPASSTYENEQEEEAAADSLMKLLSTPYSSLSQHFKRAGLDLKETVSTHLLFLLSASWLLSFIMLKEACPQDVCVIA